MSRITSSVGLITGIPIEETVAKLMAVAARPRELVANRTKTIDAERLAINILGEHQEEVSRLFARKSEPEPGTLRGVGFRIGRTGAPVLDDCLAYMECEVAETLDGGDHSIFLGKVVDEAVVNEVKPLLFYRGGYHSLP